ncbi:MAG: YraN family protein, partial [Phycisphaerae bacterium]
MIDRAALGRRGERAAARYLKRRRYRILAKNFSCSLGELDLICADGAEVVFVEVKTRTTGAMFDVTDAVRTCQVDRIARTARWFL